MNYKKKREVFWSEAKINEGNTSKIWSVIRKDFQTNESNLRGYGLTDISNYRRKTYLKLSRLLGMPFIFFSTVLLKFRKAILRLLSWIILNFDSLASKKYGFDNYDASIYDSHLIHKFHKDFSKNNINFSHNTLKSFYYLENLTPHIGFNNKLSIFEIGAGVFNFGHLLSLKLESFEYVVCDLPEMVFQAHKEITDFYIPKAGADYEVFLPNEVDEFNDSAAHKKVLFITPNQLKKGVLGNEKRFDIFVNHESFAEMDIFTVNNYLEEVKSLMKPDSILNIVNRHSRPQAVSAEDYINLTTKDITCFDDYALDFCSDVVKEIDCFRSRIPGERRLPNVYYIGKVNK